MTKMMVKKIAVATFVAGLGTVPVSAAVLAPASAAAQATPATAAGSAPADHASRTSAQVEGAVARPGICRGGNACLYSSEGKIVLSTAGNWSVGDDVVWAVSVRNAGTAGTYDHIKVKAKATHGPIGTVCLSRGKKHDYGMAMAILSIKWVKSC